MFITCRWLWLNDGLHYKASDCNIGIVCMTDTLSNNACREVFHCESMPGPRSPRDWELGIKSIQNIFWYFPESALGALEAGRVEVAKGGDQPLSWKHLMSWWSSLKWEQLKLQLYHLGAVIVRFQTFEQRQTERQSWFHKANWNQMCSTTLHLTNLSVGKNLVPWWSSLKWDWTSCRSFFSTPPKKWQS